jgi:arylsulfatase A-like enzyme
MSISRRAASFLTIVLLSGIACVTTRPAPARTASRPNVVLIFPDNLGWGEVGAYGSVRNVPTPRLDRMAAEGIRLNNFNVEFSCTVSRAALMTGRYAARTGAAQEGGMTLWEVTIPEALKPLGYATAIFGKWHLGGTNWLGRRAPTDQGFDEWYGIPMTSNEAQTTTLPGYDSTKTPAPYIWEGKAGEVSKRVKLFDLQTRRTIDREAAQRGIAFMERNVREQRPFFLYYAMTQIHFPTLTHPDFMGKTGAGDIGDAMAEVDHNVGLVLDAIKRLGIDENTMVLWCADNGAEGRRPWRGTSGPWTGFYNTVMEGGIRTPCIIRWPGHIPGGQVSNDIVHEIDFFPTIAAAVGAPEIVPKDRAIDGVNEARLEAPLCVPAGARNARSAGDEAVQSARGSEGRDGRAGGESVGAQRDGQARRGFQPERCTISTRAAGSAGPVRSAGASVTGVATASCRRSASSTVVHPTRRLSWFPRSNALETRATVAV